MLVVRQIRFALKDVDGEFDVHKAQGRVYVDCEGEYDYEETVESLQRVFGIVGLSGRAPAGYRISTAEKRCGNIYRRNVSAEKSDI